MELKNLPLEKMDKNAIKELRKAHSKNVIIFMYEWETIPKEIRKIKKWFTDNGYDPEVKMTNEIWGKIGKKKYEWKDPLDQVQLTEALKTEYSNKWLDLTEQMSKLAENEENVQNSIKMVNEINKIIKSLNKSLFYKLIKKLWLIH